MSFYFNQFNLASFDIKQASFNFPYNDTYELLFKCNRTIRFTIEINKKIYLEGDNFDTLKDNILPLKKYLDEFFLFLLHL